MKTKTTFVTPKGVAAYPYLTRADYAYNVEGIYKTKLRVDEAEAKELMADIKALIAEEFGSNAKAAKLPFKKDPDTGTIEFNTKSKFKPKLMDSKGSVIPEDTAPPIYGGSVLKCAGTLYPYNAGGNIGISMQLGGVQVIELSDGGNSDFAFAEEEGGYVSEPTAANDNEAAGDEAYNF